MHKPYQSPRARIISISPEVLLAASKFGGSSVESFGIENLFGSTQSTSEGFSESYWGNGGASNEGFTEKNIGE